MSHLLRISFLPGILTLLLTTFSCSGEVAHDADAVPPGDTLFMNARGINTLISDSGVMRYHMVAEEWNIYTDTTGRQPTWKFFKGLLMERFDEKFHIDLFIQADTAYLHEQYLWELRGRVVIRNIKNEVFRTEEVFWNMNTHEIWSHKYMHIVTPERQLEGTEFHSNEQMTCYSVSNSIGAFPVSDSESPTGQESTASQPGDQAEQVEAEPAASTQNPRPRPVSTANSRFLPAPDKR